jgi:hypothetical protein
MAVLPLRGIQGPLKSVWFWVWERQAHFGCASSEEASKVSLGWYGSHTLLGWMRDDSVWQPRFV